MTHPWKIIYTHYEPLHQRLREALCTLGNGYFATRGAFEEVQADEIHYPGTYIAGGFNKLESMVAGRRVVNEDLVNFPNWLVLNFRPDQGEWVDYASAEIISHRVELDLYQAMLTRKTLLRDREGRETEIKSRRIVHMYQPHLAAIEYKITPRNWSGIVEIQSALDGSVVNAGVARYRQLNSKHLHTLEKDAINDERIYLRVQTNQSRLEVVEVARTQIFDAKNQRIEFSPKIDKAPEKIAQLFKVEATQNQPLTVEKTITLYTSKDFAISECLLDAKETLDHTGRFKAMLKLHQQVWHFLWNRCDVEIDTSGDEQQIVRLHIFHLLQTVSPNTMDLDTGVPARGLHGEAYRGHIFWDELFIFPFYFLRTPEVTRSLLLYRYRRLNMARRLAQENGYQGAMYPWQSGSNGQDESQQLHLNVRDNTWIPDYSHLQRHVNAAIVYNVWAYYQHTKDIEFIYFYGAEMVLDIARFWSSITTYNPSKGRYEIKGVMGPDEYHEKYPDAKHPGLNNNAYTNVMAVWVLERALEILDLLPPDRREELTKNLSITAKDTERWRNITQKMIVPFIDDDIIAQFEGYEQLEELDWARYQETYWNIERMDRILKAENDTPDRYKVSKQADVLMLFYLFSIKELRRLFRQLGYRFSQKMLCKNLEYYGRRTSHGSTLSKVVFAAVTEHVDEASARQLYKHALRNDISDIQGGTTAEGIHLGAMAGTVDIVLRAYAGVSVRNNKIRFHPHLPEDVKRLKFRLKYCGQWYEVEIDKRTLKLHLVKCIENRIKVYICDQLITLTPACDVVYHFDTGQVECR